jgi:outer membrane biosynthesis protein TonB
MRHVLVAGSEATHVSWKSLSRDALRAAVDKLKTGEHDTIDILVAGTKPTTQQLVDAIVAFSDPKRSRALAIGVVAEASSAERVKKLIEHRKSSPPSVAIGQPDAQGELDKAIIRRYIKRNTQKIRYCYEKELLAKPTIEGMIAATFVIDDSGKVSEASGSGFDQEVASCVANAIKAIEFPKPKAGSVRVNYPFTFRRQG